MTERIPVVENILSANDRLAERKSRPYRSPSVFSINLMASPGAGKTSLIEKTPPSPQRQITSRRCGWRHRPILDADRASAAGAQASIQVNTGGECHLDAVMFHGALNQLDLKQFDLLMVENVRDLVCPASSASAHISPCSSPPSLKAQTNPTNTQACIVASTPSSSTKSTSSLTSTSTWTSSVAALKPSTQASSPSRSRAAQAKAWTRGSTGSSKTQNNAWTAHPHLGHRARCWLSSVRLRARHSPCAERLGAQHLRWRGYRSRWGSRCSQLFLKALRDEAPPLLA